MAETKPAAPDARPASGAEKRVLAAEGAVALMVPVVAGAWSDQLKTPIGGRLPFVLFGAPAIGLAVALRGLHAVVVAARARRVPVLHRLLRGVPSPIARGTRTS